MKKVRLQGLVKLASSVRRELSLPIAPARLAVLHKRVTSSLLALDRFFRDEGLTENALPAPSRKALQFLRSVDFSKIKPSDKPEGEISQNARICFPGLKRFFQAVVDDLAHQQESAQRQRVYQRICDSNAHLETEIRKAGLSPSQFSAETRDIRGWFAYFARPENFQTYLLSLDQASRAFAAVLPRSKRFHSPAVVRFIPSKGLYRALGSPQGTVISLPTPMISFDEALFVSLAELIFEQKNYKQKIINATLAESYLAIRSELDLLSGLAETPAGVYHDLQAAFERVNAAYFQSKIVRPRLGWTQTFTHRRFGCYDYSRDILTVSATLDQSAVPEFVVDFIVYHELLHKKLGIRWQNDRKGVHTPEFLREEKKFSHYAQASEVLKKLALS